MKKIIYSVMMFAIATFTLTSCEDVPAPYGFPEESGGKEIIPIGDPEGTGAQEDPYNVAAALTRVNAMADGETTEEIYVKGVISTISEVSVENGNATYFISDDGTTAHELQVYRGRYLGGAKFTEEGQIKVGDEVIVKGKCKNFKGNTPEFDTGSEIYMLNGVMAEVVPMDDPKGTGVQNDPYNVAAALNLINPMPDGQMTDEIYVEGIVSTIQEVSVKNGNATYFISDNGSPNNELEIYRGKYLGGKAFTSEDQLKVGDKVIVKGKCKNFKGNTPEFDTGSIIYMINGEVAEEKPMADPTGTGTQTDPYNVAAALNLITPMADGQLTDEIYVKGIISKIQEVSVQNGNATYFISDDGTEDNQLEVYRGKYLNGADFTSASQIKVGDVVIVKGKCKNFKGNTPEFDTGNVLYSLNGQTEGGDTPGQDGNITKTVDGSVITITDNSVTATAGVVDMIDLSQQDALGWEDKQAENLVVNTNMGTVSFEKGEGRNAPAYYPPVVRMYAKNYFTAGGGNMKVAKIVITCDGSYTGNQTLYAEADGTLMTVYNEHSSNSGGTQLRIKTIEIYYGE